MPSLFIRREDIMGNAAKRVKVKRRKFFKKLSELAEEKFRVEFEKRISSWLFDIDRYAAKLTSWKGEQRPPVFSIVDEAMGILEFCGRNIVAKYERETHELLTTHGCVAFAKDGVPEICRMSNARALELSNYRIDKVTRLKKSGK